MFTQRKTILSIIAGVSLALSQSAIAKDRVVHFYNWAGQIGNSTISDFEKSTGIKLVYDVYDSNEALEG